MMMMSLAAGCGGQEEAAGSGGQDGEGTGQQATMGRYVETERNLPDPLEEAGGIYKLPDGQLVLIVIASILSAVSSFSLTPVFPLLLISLLLSNGATYDVYLWLQENSYRYGFIFRYPGHKTELTGVAEEVWHYVRYPETTRGSCPQLASLASSSIVIKGS